ncbi:MAG: hypothetical protein M3Y56_16280, partial [Armatimonadota bacterium]|nr:hypothetical protein [Armatimonadota bacterium]
MTFVKKAIPASLYLALLLQFLTPADAVPTATPALPNLPPEYDISLKAVSPTGAGTARISFNTQPNGQGYALLIG